MADAPLHFPHPSHGDHPRALDRPLSRKPMKNVRRGKVALGAYFIDYLANAKGER
jgi:hypothetical protein